MKLISYITNATLAFFIASNAVFAQSPTPVKKKPEWGSCEPRALGDRKASLGFATLGDRPCLMIALSAKDGDKKTLPISHLKVTALDKNGVLLVVNKHYQDGLMYLNHDFYSAEFDVGTFVQNTQPNEVSVVTVTGFGGKITVQFVDGNAQKLP